ncbi:MAG TPA: hypothetical protein VMU59_14210 [Caulobacteraceae bacterium]|nr:hypothetical protein [Caulobacteraceae bacterium]
MAKRQTHAQWLGIQLAPFRTRTNRRVASIRRILLQLAADWGDVDSLVIDEIDRLVDRLQAAIAEGYEQLQEPADD